MPSEGRVKRLADSQLFDSVNVSYVIHTKPESSCLSGDRNPNQKSLRAMIQTIQQLGKYSTVVSSCAPWERATSRRFYLVVSIVTTVPLTNQQRFDWITVGGLTPVMQHRES